MDRSLLALNSGSSSLKFTLFTIGNGIDDVLNSEQEAKPEVIARGQIDGIYTKPHFRIEFAFSARIAKTYSKFLGNKTAESKIDRELASSVVNDHDSAMTFLLEELFEQFITAESMLAIGHRVVHGGEQFTAATLINQEVLDDLEPLVPLAPLHQPHHLAAMRAISKRLPLLPQVACFDTAFHRTLPWRARIYALPKELSQHGVRRFGFHGLSFESIAGRLSVLDPEAYSGRTVVAHLGNGSSVCGMFGGQSQVTSMGMTPLDGLPMGTRCGSLDPGLLLYLQETTGITPLELRNLLYNRSGLLGLSGISSDMRELLESQAPSARTAVDFLVYRASCEIASSATALRGMDALVFTGGIGENSHFVRKSICEQLEWLGVRLGNVPEIASDQCISDPESRCRVWVIATDEESIIARQTLQVLQKVQAGSIRPKSI